MFRKLPVFAFLLLLVMLPPVQVGRSGPPEPVSFPQGADASHARPGEIVPPTPEEIRREKAMRKEQTKLRYQEIRHDSEQLVLLANQLKRYVDTAGENILSVDVVKKADEIEKLARNVRTKMKGD